MIRHHARLPNEHMCNFERHMTTSMTEIIAVWWLSDPNDLNGGVTNLNGGFSGNHGVLRAVLTKKNCMSYLETLTLDTMLNIEKIRYKSNSPCVENTHRIIYL